MGVLRSPAAVVSMPQQVCGCWLSFNSSVRQSGRLCRQPDMHIMPYLIIHKIASQSMPFCLAVAVRCWSGSPSEGCGNLCALAVAIPTSHYSYGGRKGHLAWFFPLHQADTF